MKKIKSVEACGCDEPSSPLAAELKNPYEGTFLSRVLLKYQVLPTSHPYNPLEKSQDFTPETLSYIEKSNRLSKEERDAIIKKRDSRWRRGPG